MTTLPSLVRLSFASTQQTTDRIEDDNGSSTSAPVGGMPSSASITDYQIVREQALVVDAENKHRDQNTSLVWNVGSCPSHPDDVDPLDIYNKSSISMPATTPRNVIAYWYSACGQQKPEFALGEASERRAHEATTHKRSAAQVVRISNANAAGPVREPVKAVRNTGNGWEYYAFPADYKWMKLPLFNPWVMNEPRHKSGFHNIVFWSDNHPLKWATKRQGEGAPTKLDFDRPASYPYQHGNPQNHSSHLNSDQRSWRPYYTPYSREDAAELYYKADNHTRNDERMEDERPLTEGGSSVPVWTPSIEHIVPKARFTTGLMVRANNTDLQQRAAYGPNDPNGWMLERAGTNTLREDWPLSFSYLGANWRVPGSERGRVARKWLYMQATYGPLQDELRPPPPVGQSRPYYAITPDQLANRTVILEAARSSPITLEEAEADSLMRRTYGWGNPLLDPTWRDLFLGTSAHPQTDFSLAFEHIVFYIPPRTMGGGKGGKGGKGGRGGQPGRGYGNGRGQGNVSATA